MHRLDGRGGNDEEQVAKPVEPPIPDDEKKSTNFYREKLYKQIASSQAGLSGGQESRRGLSGR